MSLHQFTDKRFIEELPYPVALSWRRYLVADNEAAKVTQLHGCLDIMLRLMTGYLLADYLSGKAIEKVEAQLRFLQKPSLGHYRSLIRTIIFHKKDAFFQDVFSWHFKSNGKPSQNARNLDKLIELRNETVHGHAQTEVELRRYREEFSDVMEKVLLEANWLYSYRLFSIQNTQPARKGGFWGHIKWYMGFTAEPMPQNARWSPSLFPKDVYLCNPEGTSILDLSPFLGIFPYESIHTLFLLVEIPKNRKVVLRLDSVGFEIQKEAMIADEEMHWDAFLKRREEKTWLFKNTLQDDFQIKESIGNKPLLGDQYKVVEKLGEGAMAEVFSIKESQTGNLFALKIIRNESLDKTSKERFKREFQIMFSLSHPHIISVDSPEILPDGRYGIKMELMPGGTLKELLEERLASPQEVARWGSQILSALHYLYERSIVHRDIKPSNLLLDESGMVKLSDFGIAKQEKDGRLTTTGENIGSWAYMAPEVRLEHANPSLQSDLFSLAVTMHELVTGELSDRPGEKISGQLGTLIRQLGAKNPQDRLKAFDIIIDPNALSQHFGTPKNKKQKEPPKRSLLSKMTLGCTVTILLVCVGMCVPIPKTKKETIAWTERYVKPLRNDYEARKINTEELGHRLRILEKDILEGDVNPPHNICYQDALIASLGDLHDENNYRLESFQHADGTPRKSPIRAPEAPLLTKANQAVMTKEEARNEVARIISTYRNGLSEAIEQVDNESRPLFWEFFYSCTRRTWVEGIKESVIQARRAGLYKTLSATESPLYEIPDLIKLVQNEKSEIKDQRQRKIKKGGLLDVHGVVTQCEGLFFHLEQVDTGGRKSGIMVEILPPYLNQFMEIRTGDFIHVRCVVDYLETSPYRLTSCIRKEPNAVP